MLRCMTRAIIVIIFIIVRPQLAAADQWDEYSAFMDRFYHLDKQDFNAISCQIVVSSLVNSLETIRDQFKALEGKVEVTDNLGQFRLNYSKGEGLTFQRPSFEVKIVSKQGMKDPKKVEKGIEMIKQGLESQVDGIVQMLEGLFESYVSPRKEAIRIKELSIGPSETTVVYEDDESTNIETYSGETSTSKILGALGQIEADVKYTAFEGKRIIRSIDYRVIQGTVRTNMTAQVEYQVLGSLVLPTKIWATMKLVSQDTQQQTKFDVTLIDWKVF